MGVKVITASADQVRLSVPLEPNLNHRKTAFGGSASASAILACWSVLFMKLVDYRPQPEVVIQANRLQYLRPIKCDFEVATVPIEQESWDAFARSLERRGRGRVHAHSYIESEGERCCEFSGIFVALQKES
jgi:thioesterase domain-containing protein